MISPSDLAANAQAIILEMERRLLVLERRAAHPDVTVDMLSRLREEVRRDLRNAIGEPSYRDWEEVFGGPLVTSRGGMTLRPISPATVSIEGVLGHTFQSCRAERSASQSISSSVWTAVSLDVETWDTDGYFAPTSKVMTIPAGMAGLYLVNYSVHFLASSGSQRGAALAINNSTDTNAGFIDRRLTIPDVVTGLLEDFFGGSTLVRLSAADTLTLKVFQDTGGSLNILGIAGARGYGTALEIVRIGS